MKTLVFLSLLWSQSVFAYMPWNGDHTFGVDSEDCVRSLIQNRIDEAIENQSDLERISPGTTVGLVIQKRAPLKFVVFTGNLYHEFEAVSQQEVYFGHIFANVSKSKMSDGRTLCFSLRALNGQILPLVNYNRSVFSLVDEKGKILLNDI